MRVVSALEVRRRFGQLIDEAAAGERLIIERAGQPVAAIVPLSDVAELDPDRRRSQRLEAIEEIRRLARRHPYRAGIDAVRAVRESRRLRDEQIMRAVKRGHQRPTR